MAEDTAPPAPPPFVGPLDDKDRIFTNVYGFQDWGIDAAMKRGDWDDTKKLLEIGQDEIINRIKASGPSKARTAVPASWSSMPTNPSRDRARTARSSVTIRTS